MLPFLIRSVVMIKKPIDFRKQWNGLLVEARNAGFDPYLGHLVVFIKRDKTQLRAIGGDERGLYLISRRFDGGRLTIPFDDQQTTISQAELSMWLDGAHFSLHKYVKKWTTSSM